VNLLIAGYDNEKAECQFYVLDYLASMVTTKYAAHGYGGFFSTALIDSKYRPGKEIKSIKSVHLVKAR
jgi:20S proteasome subunit beta 4